MVPPLVAFDFDGTLTDDEMIVHLAAERGVADEVARLTERAMRGEISYAASLRDRVRLLAGLDEGAVVRAADRVRLRRGVRDTVVRLRDNGVYVAVISGSFRRGLARCFAAERVVVDTVISNELVIRDGRLTGDVRGPLIEGAKDRVFGRCAMSIGCAVTDSVAVGDGANDIPMLRAAGVAVGMRPAEHVAAYCDHVIEEIPEVLPIVSLRA